MISLKSPYAVTHRARGARNYNKLSLQYGDGNSQTVKRHRYQPGGEHAPSNTAMSLKTAATPVVFVFIWNASEQFLYSSTEAGRTSLSWCEVRPSGRRLLNNGRSV